MLRSTCVRQLHRSLCAVAALAILVLAWAPARVGAQEEPQEQARRVFGLTEASTSRRAVCVGRPIAASSGSVLAGESFTLRVQALNKRTARSTDFRLQPALWGPPTDIDRAAGCVPGAAKDDAARGASVSSGKLVAPGRPSGLIQLPANQAYSGLREPRTVS